MSNVANRLAKKNPGRPGAAKQVRLKLVYLNLGSSVMVSLLIGLVLGVLAILTTLVAWAILTRTGAFDQLDSLISGVTGSGSGAKSVFSFSRAIGLAVILGLINLIVVTVFGTVFTLVYNLLVKLTGGLFVGFINK